MLPDLTSLALFLKAADLRSLSQAATQQHIALSAASRRIALLEDRFGVTLFRRVRGGVELTPAGAVLIEEVRQILRHVEDLKARASEFDQEGGGEVRVAGNPAVMGAMLPAQLAAFRQRFPKVILQIRELSSTEIVKEVRENNVDLGIVTSGAHCQGLQLLRYQEDRLCVVAPSSWSSRRRVEFSVVLDHPLVCLERSLNVREQLVRSAAIHGRVPDIRLQVRSTEAACRLISAGFGLGVLSQASLEMYLRSMGLKTFALSEPWAVREMVICTPKARLSAATALLVKHLHAAND